MSSPDLLCTTPKEREPAGYPYVHSWGNVRIGKIVDGTRTAPPLERLTLTQLA